MTNLVLQFLHTTAAYQAAVAQLMIGEANLAAGRLGLPGWEPITRTNEIGIYVSRPPFGVAGVLSTTNYRFGFEHGQLTWVERIKRLEGAGKNWPTLEEMAKLSSVADSNEVRAVASQWLGALHVPVADLNNAYPCQVKQTRHRGAAGPGNQASSILTPIFNVAWGTNTGRNAAFNPVFIETRGDTKELWELRIRVKEVATSGRFALTNADDLLGPLAPPCHFVAQLFGGEEAYQTLLDPDELQVTLLDHPSGEPPKPRTPSRKAKLLQARELSRVLADFDSYAWDSSAWGRRKLCIPEYGVQLRFAKRLSVVEVMLCFKCDILQVLSKGQSHEENFDFAHDDLLRLLRKVWPKDRELAKVEMRGDSAEQRAKYYQTLENALNN